MRQLLCQSCARDKQSGERMLLARSLDGEPAEYERVAWGTARTPQPEQRVIYLNDAPFPMDPDVYTCDECSADIRPGERCCAWTVWAEDRVKPGAWEREYFE